MPRDAAAVSPRPGGAFSLLGIGDPPLYLGGLAAARDGPELRSRQVTHVVDLTASGIDYEGFRHQGVRYLRVDVQDHARTALSDHFLRINEFINMARKKHAASVLLHCSFGRGRAPAAACAYLVAHCNMSLSEALEMVNTSVGGVVINLGFMRQLCEFEVAEATRRIRAQVPIPPPATLARLTSEVRSSVDLTMCAKQQLLQQFRDGFLCRGMSTDEFSNEICDAALHLHPPTDDGLVDAMMWLEQQNRRQSLTKRSADLAAFEDARRQNQDHERRRLERDREAARQELEWKHAEAAGQAAAEEAAAAATAAVNQLKGIVTPVEGVDLTQAISEDIATALVSPDVASDFADDYSVAEDSADDAADRPEPSESSHGESSLADSDMETEPQRQEASEEIEPSVPRTRRDEQQQLDLLKNAMRKKVERKREQAATRIQSVMRGKLTRAR
jgi:hypothetical protein